MSGKIQVICALIGAVATIVASYLAATGVAKSKATEIAKSKATEVARSKATEVVNDKLKKLDVVMAGYVDSRGFVQHGKGNLFEVDRVEKGTYKIKFTKPMEIRPVVIATSDGGQEGVNIRVLLATRAGVTLEGRNYSANAKSDTAFNFLVVTPKTE